MGLRAGDLKNLVHDVFEIDTYRSKMGGDKDVVTLSFEVRDNDPAQDLVHFFESGFDYVLDADATTGEQSNGRYRVYVELERQKEVVEQILELVDGLEKLAALEDMRFRYHKQFKSKEVTQENLDDTVPVSSDAYALMTTESTMNNFKDFFSRSFLDEVHMIDDMLHIKKIYAETLSFRVLDFGDTEKVRATINESFNVNDWGEMIFLTKYIGDYNISKYGNKLTIENNGSAVVLERIMR
jgi:hypothetical protein